MKASDTNINKSIAVIARYLVQETMKWKQCDENTALEIVVPTHTYTLLYDKKSKLFAESPEYVFDMLKDELKGDFESWMKI